MLVLAFWQQLQEEQFVSCTCWQKRDFFSPCTCRTSAAFEALPYLPFLHPVGRRASHASQTKGCFGGGMDSPLQRGASSALLQHIPDPETGLTLQPTGSFAAWKPHAPPSLSTPGAGCARGKMRGFGSPQRLHKWPWLCSALTEHSCSRRTSEPPGVMQSSPHIPLWEVTSVSPPGLTALQQQHPPSLWHRMLCSRLPRRHHSHRSASLLPFTRVGARQGDLAHLATWGS